MKLLIILLLICGCAKSQYLGINTTPPRYNSIILFSGESNSGGQALNSDATTAEKAVRTTFILNNYTLNFQNLQVGVNNTILHCCYINTALYHGWELQIANQVDSATFGHHPAYLVKTGQGGSTIYNWCQSQPYPSVYKGYMDTLYNRMDTAVAQVRTLNGGVTPEVYLLYSQGINDALNPNWTLAQWKDSTKNHFARIRARYGRVPIFITLLMSPTFDTYNTKILEIASEISDCYAITTSDAPLQDPYHWSYAGMKIIARRMIDSLKTNYPEFIQ